MGASARSGGERGAQQAPGRGGAGGEERARARRGRRAILGALALSVLGAPATASLSAGCAAGFDPASKVSSLRVLAVTPSNPYPEPGETIKFTMTFHDGYEDPEEGAVTRPITVLWLGGCFDPPSDQYFGCYEQFGPLFQGGLSGASLPPLCSDSAPGTPFEYVKAGLFCDTFDLKIPEDVVTRRPKPDVGPHYGISYVFFAACAGTIGLVPPDGTGRAPDFPLGCFDGDKRLGPESFVPGYTQVYTFADERQNENPEVLGLSLGGEAMPEEDDFDKLPVVKACPLTEDERRNPGCDQSAREACAEYSVQALVRPDVGEVDPDATGEEGGELTEAVWVSYFVDRGDISPGIKLVNDAVAGFNPNIATSFLPPAEAGFATIWAVVRDARGGTGVIKRMVRVEP
jgi:hypothetical protein